MVFYFTFIVQKVCSKSCFMWFPNVIQGYVIYSVRKQYAHLKGTQIKKLKLSGFEFCDSANLDDKIIFMLILCAKFQPKFVDRL